MSGALIEKAPNIENSEDNMAEYERSIDGTSKISLTTRISPVR